MGISFKSCLEKTVFKTLVEAGFTPLYEETTFVIWQGFTPTNDYYEQETEKQCIKRCGNKSPKMLYKKMKKVLDITYTPDFTFTIDDTLIIIEAKGFENDAFPLKKKMFRKCLEDKKAMYFEVFSKTQCLQVIDILKKLQK